jgi:CheY-like chemotaxis protein
MRVLLLDDDTEFTEDVAASKPEDVVLDVAHDTGGALELLRSRRHDALILDIHMAPMLAAEPETEGLAMLGAVRGGYLGALPVVVVTDSEDPVVEEWCAKLGAARFLSKADGLSGIFAAVRDAISASPEREDHGDAGR